MKYHSVLILLLITLSIITVFLFVQNKNLSRTPDINEISNQPCTPTFADGGGPYYKSNAPFREKIVPENTQGTKLIIRVKMLENDCKTPVSNAVLDIWQANESGNYQDEWYRGRIRTDNDGNYMFESVMPKGYGEGTAYRPPHIHFKVEKNNNVVITSQMFFPDVKGKAGFEDAYIMKLERKEENGNQVLYGNHNIILP